MFNKIIFMKCGHKNNFYTNSLELSLKCSVCSGLLAQQSTSERLGLSPTPLLILLSRKIDISLWM